MTEREINNPILLFDGICNLCQASVIFILERDPAGYFRFASLQSKAGQTLLNRFQLPADDFDSFILVEQETYYVRSTAALRVLKELRGLWSLLYLFIFVPVPIRDYVYTKIAKNRYRWFGRKDHCLVPRDDLQSRFLG